VYNTVVLMAILVCCCGRIEAVYTTQHCRSELFCHNSLVAMSRYLQDHASSVHDWDLMQHGYGRQFSRSAEYKDCWCKFGTTMVLGVFWLLGSTRACALVINFFSHLIHLGCCIPFGAGRFGGVKRRVLTSTE